MSRRKIYEGLPLPDFLRPAGRKGPCCEVEGSPSSSAAFAPCRERQPDGRRRRNPCPDRPERRRQDHAVQPGFRPVSRRTRHRPPQRPRHPGPAVAPHLPARPRALVPDHQPVRRSLDLREPAAVAAGAASARFNIWRDIDSYPEVHAETAELINFLGLEGIEEIQGGELSYGGQRLVDLGIALGSKPQVLLLDEPLAGLAAAERERVSSLIKNVAANIPVLIVEHDIDRVLGFSQRVTVMNQGEVLMTGTPDAVRGDRRVQEIYTGTGIPAVEHSRSDEARESRRRCCASRASTRSTARATSCTMRRSTCAKARSWRCSAATAPANPRC